MGGHRMEGSGLNEILARKNYQEAVLTSKSLGAEHEAVTYSLTKNKKKKKIEKKKRKENFFRVGERR